MTVMIGVDPHKGFHTAVAVDEAERSLGELRVRSGPSQVDRLLAWAASFPERTWAVENATGLGYLLAQQLVAAGERVLDVQPKLAARVRLLATVAVNKNDPGPALRLGRPAGAHDEAPRATTKTGRKPLDAQRGLDRSRARQAAPVPRV